MKIKYVLINLAKQTRDSMAFNAQVKESIAHITSRLYTSVNFKFKTESIAALYEFLLKTIQPSTKKSRMDTQSHCAPMTSAPPKSGIK